MFEKIKIFLGRFFFTEHLKAFLCILLNILIHEKKKRYIAYLYPLFKIIENNSFRKMQKKHSFKKGDIISFYFLEDISLKQKTHSVKKTNVANQLTHRERFVQALYIIANMSV